MMFRIMLRDWMTIFATGAATYAPQYVAAIPQKYRALATAAIAALFALYHLYRPSPSQPDQPGMR